MKRPQPLILMKTTLTLLAGGLLAFPAALVTLRPTPPAPPLEAPVVREGTLVLPEGFELLSLDYERGGDSYLDYLTVMALDTASATQYILQYERPIGRYERPNWIIRLQYAPMADLVR